MREWLRNKCGQVARWVRQQITWKGFGLGFLIFVYSVLPDYDARNRWWKERLPSILHFAAVHSQLTLIAIGLLVIWIDHRSLVKKRSGRAAPEDTSLRGRTLALSDELRQFVNSLGPETEYEYKSAMSASEFQEINKERTLRDARLHHGFQLRFADRVIRLYHEYGERGVDYGQLPQMATRLNETNERVLEIAQTLSEMAVELHD